MSDRNKNRWNDDRGNNDRNQDRNRNREGDSRRNSSMHQGNWNEGRSSHDDNYGLGDTSQGSANYGHEDDGSGARYYGTGNYGGYFGGGSDDNDQDRGQHQDRRGNEGRSDYNENRYSNRGDNERRSYNSGNSGKGPRYGNSKIHSRGQGSGSESGNRYGSSPGYSGDSYGSGRSSDWNLRGDDRSSGYDSGRRGNSDWNRDRDWWDKTTDEVSSWFGDDDAERRREMDQRYGGHHGKGPKGYTRSDDKIKDDVEERLYHDSYIDATDIEVSVSEGEVTLSGTVDDKQTKRRAEDCADAVSGVKDVSNHLKVKRTTSYGSSTQPTSSSELGNLNSGNTGTLSDSEQKLDQSKDLDRSKNK